MPLPPPDPSPPDPSPPDPSPPDPPPPAGAVPAGGAPDGGAPDTDAPDTDAPDAIGLRANRAPSLPLGLLLVAVGGALGAAARDEIELAVPAAGGTFPVATFAINVSGALVLGALLTLLGARWTRSALAAAARPLVATGFIGAYTTWSTYMVEAAVLAKDGSAGTALAYTVASLAAGLAAAFCGIVLARRWTPTPADIGHRHAPGPRPEEG